MIKPFYDKKQIINGKSFGLSSASYDCRIKQSLVLQPNECALASTIETFNIPFNVSADVADKSSYARVFVSAMNTFIDPGFVGGLTLELVNHSNKIIEINAGDPICQIIFTWLDGKTNLPYKGKYFGQSDEPTPAIYDTTLV